MTQATQTTHPAIQGFAELLAKGQRTPILRTPDQYGMAYEEVFFPSLDGVPLEGWFIPADSDRLVICNHFLPGNRYGFPGHLEPWTGFGGFEVNFLPRYKALHDAGYNVLTYDMRNHGRSGVGSGGVVGIGLLEYRDVVGSVRYAKARKDTAKMKTSLVSMCLGGNSTIVAMHKYPDEFKQIRSLVLVQPVSTRPLAERVAENLGLEDGVELFDEAIFKLTGFHVDDLTPLPYAQGVTVPTLVTQVHDDVMTKPSDVQSIYDAIAATDKKLFWIEGTTRRFDGYNYFSEHPELMLEWLDSH